MRHNWRDFSAAPTTPGEHRPQGVERFTAFLKVIGKRKRRLLLAYGFTMKTIIFLEGWQYTKN